ncbi:hypothetical protein D4R71_00370 [bacterium]|nr:MAG: hypothetical protein D4R71_00370 [bacterium]
MVTLVNKDAQTKPIPKAEFDNTGLDKLLLTKRAGALKREYQKWQPTHKELSQYLYPTKGFFEATTPNTGSKINHTLLIDEEATFDIDTFKSGMTSGFTSPARPWFKFYLEDKELMEIEQVKWWLQDSQEVMQAVFQKSNFYSVLTSMYAELAAFGTACAIIEEDINTVIHLTNYTIGEYCLGRDKHGRINAFYRKFWMTAGQMVSEFGLGNVSDAVQIAWQGNNPDQWYLVHHLIEINNDRIPFMKDYKNMEFRTVYWQDNTGNKFLRIGGYEELPLLGPRFEFTTNADSYGKGAGWKALGSVKELQKKVKDELIAIEKGANPPLQVDASVQGEVNTLPGGITKFSAQLPNAGVKPAYEVKLDIANLDASIEGTRRKIKKFFFADLFLMMIEAEQKGSPITATEIVEKVNERISKIGPVLELWQGDEFIKSAIDRTFAICLRNNMFPEPPPEIGDIEIKVQYTSILAQAQKMVDIQAIDIWTAGVLQDAGVDESALDLINFDEKNRHKAEMLGIPPKIINSITTVANIRREKAKALEAAEAESRMAGMAEAAAKGGKAVESMGKTPMGTDSALDRTLEAVKEMNR